MHSTLIINFICKDMKDLSILQHFVGCDISKDTLDFALYERGKDYRTFEHIQVPNSPDGFKTMRKWLRTLKVRMKDAVIAMEHTGSYSMALSEWCFGKGITFVMLHPLDVRNYGGTSRNKTDKADSQFIADYAYTMREKLKPSVPESANIKQLRQLRNERQLAVRSRTAYINLLKSMPDNVDTRRIEKIIKEFEAQIKQIESEMNTVISRDKAILANYDLLLSIPGIGLVNAVTTIIATGNFTRFQTARQYAKFSCVAPLSRQSGTSVAKGDHVSKAGHNEIKSVLTEGARSAITHDSQIRAYYERKKSEGKCHGCILNAVKFKLICRMFAVVSRQRPYVDVEAYRSRTVKSADSA